MSNKKIIIFISFFALIPVLIWLPMKSMDIRFGGVIQTFVSFGQLSALVGMTLFSLSLVLSARLKVFDRYLGGINYVYQVHHFIGGLAFILLLFHPLFLLARTIPISLSYSAQFLLPEGNLAKDLGIYSLVLMIILLVLTFFVDMKY